MYILFTVGADMEEVFFQPSPEAMELLLSQHLHDTAGVLLRLAWLAGLYRSEIWELKWQDVDFEQKSLHLSNRNVPMEPRLEECLRERRKLFEGSCEYVATSDHMKKHMAPPAISRAVRDALDSVGQADVRLLDLRKDYVRRQFEEHEWSYAMRVTGISLATFRAEFQPRQTTARISSAEKPLDAEDLQSRVHAMLIAEQRSAEGIALQLLLNTDLALRELSTLTWNNFDPLQQVIRIGGDEKPLPMEVVQLLLDERNSRNSSDDPHIILSPKARKYIPFDRLSVMLRNVLIRNGIDVPISHLKKLLLGITNEDVFNYISQQGVVTSATISEYFHLTRTQAYSYLHELVSEGKIFYLDQAFYSAEHYAEACAALDAQRSKILDYIAAHGSAKKIDVQRLLDVTWYIAQKRLDELVEQNRLLFDGKIYRLSRETLSEANTKEPHSQEMPKAFRELCVAVMKYVEKHGSITAGQIDDMSKLKWRELPVFKREIVQDGLLCRVGNVYYPAAHMAEVETQKASERQIILDYVKEKGSINYSRAQRELNLSWRHAHDRLRELMEQDQLVFDGELFRLTTSDNGSGTPKPLTPSSKAELKQSILNHALESGQVTAAAAERTFGLTASKAIDILKEMAERGEIVRKSGVYYLPKQATALDKAIKSQQKQILEYVKENGSINPHRAASILSEKPYAAKLRLNELTEQQLLVFDGKDYFLPQGDVTVVSHAEKAAEIVETLRQGIMNSIDNNGPMTVSMVERAFNISEFKAYKALETLVRDGKLIHIAGAYHTPEQADMLQKEKEAACKRLLEYVKQNGSVNRKKASEILKTTPYTTKVWLRELVEQNQLTLDGKVFRPHEIATNE